MDLDTAKRLRSRLKEELTTLTNHLCIATVLSKIPNYIEEELIRLDLRIDEESISSITENYEVKIPVENEFHVFFTCGLSLETDDLDSIVQFKKKLHFELQGLEQIDPPLPFVSQYIRRMVERLEDAINEERARVAYFIRRPRATVMRSPYSRFFIEHLNACVKDVLHRVHKNNSEDCSSDQVLEILMKNYSIRIDHFVTSIVREMYYEATFPYKTKPEPAPAPEVHPIGTISDGIFGTNLAGKNDKRNFSKSHIHYTHPQGTSAMRIRFQQNI